MKLLYSRHFEGNGPALVILHGLFGSSKNWVSAAKSLTDTADVYLLDARNHGYSFNAPEHSIEAMSEDLYNWLESEKIENPVLLGHSMGGLTSMHYALHNRDKVAGLIVVDIAPRSYSIDYSDEFSALKTDLSQVSTRSEIDKILKDKVSDAGVRQFLQTSIERDDNGFRWLVNAEAIENSDQRTEFNAGDRQYNRPALFIKGGQSPFIENEDLKLIQNLFPASKTVTIENAGHWLHYTAQDEFLNYVTSYLTEIHR